MMIVSVSLKSLNTRFRRGFLFTSMDLMYRLFFQVQPGDDPIQNGDGAGVLADDVVDAGFVHGGCRAEDSRL